MDDCCNFCNYSSGFDPSMGKEIVMIAILIMLAVSPFVLAAYLQWISPQYDSGKIDGIPSR